MLVTPEDHDAGFKELACEYRRSPAPEDLPATIRIRALSFVEAGAINDALHAAKPEPEAGFNENVWRLSVLLAALPEPHNKVEFVNRLKPTCANRLTLVALQLAYGTPEPVRSADGVKKNRTDSEVTVPV